MKPETRKKRAGLSVFSNDSMMMALVRTTEHKTLAVWAISCVERVLPLFEAAYPEDHRPRMTLDTLRSWIDTDLFKMAEIRKAALASHAAAREAGQDTAARSAARAAGQAVATAHVPTHAFAAANYALQAVYRAADTKDADAAVANERSWQYQQLIRLREKTTE